MSSVIETGGAERSRRGLPTGDALVQLVALGAGASFLLVGVLGFIPGITTHHGDLGLAGHHSRAFLLGLFQVSVLHNVVHLLFGVVGLAMARKASSARSYLVVGGLAYFAIWAYGLFTGDEMSAANIVPVNMADNWLHLALAFGMIAAGTLLGHRRSSGPGAG